MGRLLYFIIASLDGYVEDSEGSFLWTRPDEEVFRFTTELEHSVGTQIYGRRMYEVMVYWEGVPTDETVSALEREFTEQWRAAEKVVFSRTLKTPSSARTRIEREFTPGLLRQLKESSGRDLAIAGPELAGQAIRAGLVDELQVMVVPKLIGGGKPWLPRDVRIDLELLESRRFSNGFVLLRYHPMPSTDS